MQMCGPKIEIEMRQSLLFCFNAANGVLLNYNAFTWNAGSVCWAQPRIGLVLPLSKSMALLF